MPDDPETNHIISVDQIYPKKPISQNKYLSSTSFKLDIEFLSDTGYQVFSLSQPPCNPIYYQEKTVLTVK